MKKFYMHNPECVLENETYSGNLRWKKKSPNRDQTTRPSDSKKKSRTYQIVVFGISEYPRVKIKKMKREMISTKIFQEN